MNIAIEFNNYGTAFHGVGKRTEACVMFQAALEVMTILSKYNGEEEISSRIDEIMKNRFVQEAMGLLQTPYQDERTNESCMATPTQHDEHQGSPTTLQSPDCPFIFRRPFKMKLACLIKKSNSDTFKLVVSAVILYNTALMGHIKWLEGPLSFRAIQSALRFYQMACDIVEQEQLEGYLFHVHLALLNNIAQINFLLGNYDLSKTYMEELRREISVHCERSASSFSTFSNENVVLQEFLLNVVLLKSPSLAAAA